MPELGPVKIGLLGLGTVGGGTVTVLRRNAGLIAARAGRRIEIALATAKDLNKPRNLDLTGIELVADAERVVDDPSIEIVAELIGGMEPARSLVLRAINNGKHVVTANKALIALHGNEIFAQAQARGVMVAFEAAVAGGIPVIKVMREALAGNDILSLAGIINGTCNFILSAMSEAGRDFNEVLADAQRLGYAEADPAFDIDGIDAAHKLTILAALAFGIPLQFENVYVEGIRAITRDDVLYAERLGYRIKHLGIARQVANGIELRVHPTLVPARQPIARVNGVMNAVLVRGDAAGPVLLSGAGAGAEATASSVIADLVDVVRALTSDPENRVPHLAFQPDTLEDLPILPIDDIETAYYLRLMVADQPGVLADVTRILSDRGISIEAIIQLEHAALEIVPIVILTHRIKERAMNDAMAAIEQLSAIEGKVARIRVETLA
ncbi:MAG: homoserine dehydrogenase [Gammaproteobacteria bacterium]|nr:homoserine dehydrogenase [Gammaproteobacteria bacterium]